MKKVVDTDDIVIDDDEIDAMSDIEWADQEEEIARMGYDDGTNQTASKSRAIQREARLGTMVLRFDTVKLNHDTGNHRAQVDKTVKWLASSFATTGIFKHESPLFLLVKQSYISNIGDVAKSPTDKVKAIEWAKDGIPNRGVSCLAGQHREAAMKEYREGVAMKARVRDKRLLLEAKKELEQGQKKGVVERELERLRAEVESAEEVYAASKKEHTHSFLWPVILYDAGK